MNRPVLATALAAAVVLAACDGSPDTTPSPDTTTPAATATSAASDTSTPSPSPAPSPSPTTTPIPTAAPSPSPTAGPSSAASTTAAAAFEPFTVPVGESQTDLSSRIQVEVTEVEVRPDGLLVSVSSFNDTTGPAALAVQPDAVVVHDVDNRRYYTLRAPEDNPTLEFGPSEELTASIAFPAAFREPPTRIEILFNYTRDPLERLDDDAGGGDVEPLQLLFGNIDLDPGA